MIKVKNLLDDHDEHLLNFCLHLRQYAGNTGKEKVRDKQTQINWGRVYPRRHAGSASASIR